MNDEPLKPFFAKIAGVTKNNPDGTNRQRIVRHCRAGEALTLVREPANPFDKNAVAVCRATGEQLGYLPAHIAEEIAPRLDRGGRVDAKISNITGGGWFSGKSYGVNIRVTKYRLPSM